MWKKYSVESVRILALSAVLFSMAWFWLSFTFPLVLVSLKFNYFEIGSIGTLTSFPFIIFSFLFINSKKKHLNFALKIPYLVIASATVILLLGYENSDLYILIIGITSIFQSMWWISTEIETGLLGVEGLAEKYSAAWGIPSGIFPIIAGYVIEVTGFRGIYILVLVVSLLGLVIQPIDTRERIVKRVNRLTPSLILPMTFSGIDLGFVTFVLVPFIRVQDYSYFSIGVYSGIFSIFFSLGSLLGNVITIKNQQLFSFYSSLMAASPLLLLLGINMLTLSVSLSLGGFGASLGFSKVLGYINRTDSPRIGVFYYETLFSIGYITGTLIGGFLSLAVSFETTLVLFIPSLFFSLYSLNKSFSKPELFVPSDFK